MLSGDKYLGRKKKEDQSRVREIESIVGAGVAVFTRWIRLH